MRSRLLVLAIVALSSVSAAARAQDSYADGLVPGDYLRLSGGLIAPVNAQGSLRDWDRGTNVSLSWDNWGGGASGTGLVGFGLALDYSQFPLKTTQFISDFSSAGTTQPTSASASSATSYQIATTVRVRIPSPFIMPSLVMELGFLDFHPSTIHYTSPTGDGTASQRHRRGASFSFGGGLDKQIVDRFALFGEALYTYAFTSLGQGFVTPGGTCSTSGGCDVLKNTSLGIVRGGLRVHIGR